MIRMMDGTTKAAEFIEVGDVLIGPDSKPRLVVSTTWGVDDLYEVRPAVGEPYVVNSQHVLSLVMSNDGSEDSGSVVNLPVLDYLSRSKYFRHRAKGWSAAVDYPQHAVPVDPYILGAWLGDGDSRGMSIVTMDQEIVDEMRRVASSHDGVSVIKRQEKGRAACYSFSAKSKRWSSLTRAMSSLGVFQNKHIPACYMANSREIRLELLAGIIDTDGYCYNNCYSIVQVRERLARDIAGLARSLGFRATVRQVHKTCGNNRKRGVYWDVSISGQTSLVPCRLKRKQCSPRRQKKNVLRVGITVTPVGRGDYFGFQIAGPDSLFLLGDYTVTHNSRCMTEVIEGDVAAGKKVVLYTNRRMLLEQISGVLEKHSIDFGVRAAGYDTANHKQVQLSSIPTEVQRVYKTKKWNLFPADTILVDEAHNQVGDTYLKVLLDHQRRDGHIIGFTATPLDIGHIYRQLVVAGTNSELRECGAHVICHTFAPDEPDTRGLKKQPTGEYTENDVRKVIMTPVIFGRVYEYWKKLNPDAKPTILFGPGVGESLWFAEQFYLHGVSAAHIDGDSVWVNGQHYSSDAEARAQVIEDVRKGEIKIICNRFVLREGIDIPELYHCIFATVFGSLKSYLQSGGRLLRSHPSLDHVICQDHGGNWWRHGDLNEDRTWELELTSHMVSGIREANQRDDKEPEPLVCPKCYGYRLWGDTCPYCGYRHTTRTRLVIEKSGKLKAMEGRIHKPRRIKHQADTEKIWLRCLHRCKRSGMTFNQAEGLFFRENYYYPPRTLAGMPTNQIDWYLPIKNVPVERCYTTAEPAQPEPEPMRRSIADVDTPW